MTFNNREELLNRLWSDYREHEKDIERCFIYNYLKNRKDAKAIAVSASRAQLLDYRARPRCDRYILLQAALIAYKNKIITPEMYTEIYTEVSKKEKLGKKSVPNNPDEALARLENKMLKDAVGDFFTNNGFKKGSDDPLKNALDSMDGGTRNLKKVKDKDKGHIDDIEMASLFEETLSLPKRIPVNAALLDGGITKEYINKCRELFLLAKSSASDEMLVPLYFDSQSGAGVFIVGNRIFGNSKGDNCAPFIFWFWLTDAPEEPLNPEDLPALPMIMKTRECNSIDEAFLRFSKQRGGERYYEGYADMNYNIIPAEEADAVFKRLLISSSEDTTEFDREHATIEKEKREENEYIRKLEGTKTKPHPKNTKI